MDCLRIGHLAEIGASLPLGQIGRMEEGSSRFKEALINALNSNKRVLATIRWHDSEFSKKIKSRDDVKLIKLTVPEREEIYRQILNEILKDKT